MNVKQNTRSDELSDLRKLFSEEGLFSGIKPLLQIDLILDANAVLADLRWLVCKAKNPSARTKLLESMDSETIVAYAPTYLEIEIQKNIPLIATQENVDPALLFNHWSVYKAKINFLDSGGPEEGAIDPKDAPYVKLHNTTGFPVLSEDPHISKMGAKVVTVQVTALAQSYSRDAVVEYKIKAGAMGTFTVSAVMINAASELLRSLINLSKQIPVWAWLLVIAGIGVALSLDFIRDWIKQKIISLPSKAKKSAIELFNILEPLVIEHQESKRKAAKTENSLSELLS